MAIAIAGPTPWATPTARAVSSPVAHWKLDDGSGLAATDHIGTADGTLADGAAWLTSNAAVGTGAVRFDGINDRITVPSSAAIEPIEALITFWVRGAPGDEPAAGEVLLEKGAFGCDGPSYGFYVATNAIRFSFRTPNGEQLNTTVTEAEAKVDLWDGSWHLLAARAHRNGQTSVAATLFLDAYPPGFGAVGDILSSGSHTSAIRYTGATHSELAIGGPVDAGCGGAHFDGDVDDVRLYADPWFLYGTLMPPITTTITGIGTPTAHPGESISRTVNVAPAPRWGGVVGFNIFRNNTWDGLCCAASIDPETGDATSAITAPTAVGVYQIRAHWSGDPPYQGSEQSTTLTVVKWPSTTTLSSAPATKYPFTPITLTASVDSTSMASSIYPQGSVKFWETTSGTPVLLGTSSVYPVAPGDAGAQLTVNNFAGGTHKVLAEYIGPDAVRAGSSSVVTNIVVSKFNPTIFIGNLTGNPVDANSPFDIGAVVESAGTSYASGATMSFTRVGAGAPTCTAVPVVLGAHTRCKVPSLAVGTWQFVASYSGNANTNAKLSDTLTVNVVANTVHASGVGTAYTTFYPYKDSYKDSVAIRGTRNEPIGVTIKIYNPGGTLIKTATVAQGSGAYSYAWTGRKSDGTMYAEGKYKVVQTLKDAGGLSKAYTSYVTLSKKKLFRYTKTVTKLGSSVTAKGTLGTGTVTINTSSDFTKVYAAPDTFSWAGAGWELTLPEASVYESFYVRIYGRRTGSPGLNRIGAQRFSTCAYSTTAAWKEECFSAWVTIPVTSGTTLYYYKTANLASDYRTSGRKVRLMVMTTGGSIWVYKAQVVVHYGLLRYP